MTSRYKRIYLTVCLLSALPLTPVLASGAFSPFFGDIGNAEFNKGKALFSGRIGAQGCTTCHDTFDRSRLMGLKTPVSDYISNCQAHKPCYSKMSEKDKSALETYLKRRYHL